MELEAAIESEHIPEDIQPVTASDIADCQAAIANTFQEL